MSLATEVKSRLNLVEMVRKDGYNLKRESGDRYSCCCPFHQEKTPSFKVDETFQRFHCFGCGESGDSIAYYAKQNALDYKTALFLLAEELGIHHSKKHSENKTFGNQKRALEVVSLLFQFFQKEFQALPPSHLAKQEITKRGLSIEKSSSLFGYAPKEFSRIQSFLQENHISEEEIKELGFLSSYGYFLFSDRLVFPVRNYLGREVGFVGRSLEHSPKRKYVNSPNSLVFDKSQILFNIDQAKHMAKEQNTIFLVEGQFDVIQMVQNGFQNTCAISGTSFTPSQLNLIGRVITDTGKIVLCLDGDEAGKKAVFKLFQKHPSIQSRLYVVIFPNNQDPCEYLQENHSLPKEEYLVSWLLQEGANRFPPNQLETKSAFLNWVQSEITQYIQDKTFKEIVLKQACDLAGVTFEFLKQKSTSLTQEKHSPESHSSISKEDSLYIFSLAIYWKHRKGITLCISDYPKRYSEILKQLLSYEKESLLDAGQFSKGRKLIQEIVKQDVCLLPDMDSAKSYYLNILNLAKKETRRIEQERQKAALVRDWNERRKLFV